MAKQAVWTVVIVFVFAQASAMAAKPGDDSRQPSASRGASGDASYRAASQALNAPETPAGPSFSDVVSQKFSEVAEFVATRVSDQKPVASITDGLPMGFRTAGQLMKTPPTRRVPQRGDPKTTYSQSENRYHSAKQVPPPDTDPAPDPAPDPVPDPAPGPAPDPTPGPAPDPVLDLTQWTVANTYQSGTMQLSVYFRPAADGMYDVVLVVYDTATGEPLSATGYRTETVTAMPDTTGFTFVTTVTRQDGSRTEKYALFAAGSASWSDVTTWIEIEYDASGTFLTASIKTIEELALETLALPSLDTIVF